MKESIRCLLQTVSPIHVGCDEVYEPMGFILEEQPQQLIAFNALDFFSQMDWEDKQRFSQICSKGTISSILEIYKFLRGRMAKGKSIDVCQGFVEQYHRTLSIPLQDKRRVQQELNNFAIARTSFSPSDQRPYIPGSAVKGALRTAYLNTVAKAKKLPPYKGKGAARKLEKALLEGGEFSTDPFRMVKVSDLNPVGKSKTKIIYAVNEKKIPSRFEARGPYQILEVIEPGAQFHGWITVEEPERKAGIETPISLEDLLKSAALFYNKEKKREDEELNRIGVSNVSVPDNENKFLIRLGRHSGAESVTIEGHRSIKIITAARQKPQYKDHATTLWLASELPKPKGKKSLQPFGWAALAELSGSFAQEVDEKEKTWRLMTEAERAQQLAEQERIRQTRLERETRMKEESQRQAVEEERWRQEEQRRKAELEAMSPEERDIAALQDTSITEDQVIEIYSRIDASSEENKKLLAQALREHWMARGKWKKKDCSKKQLKKVQKVKGILGED